MEVAKRRAADIRRSYPIHARPVDRSFRFPRRTPPRDRYRLSTTRRTPPADRKTFFRNYDDKKNPRADNVDLSRSLDDWAVITRQHLSRVLRRQLISIRLNICFKTVRFPEQRRRLRKMPGNFTGEWGVGGTRTIHILHTVFQDHK